MTIVCSCGEPLEAGWKVCPVCKKSVARTCEQCGLAQKPHWRACPRCGTESANSSNTISEPGQKTSARPSDRRYCRLPERTMAWLKERTEPHSIRAGAWTLRHATSDVIDAGAIYGIELNCGK